MFVVDLEVEVGGRRMVVAMDIVVVEALTADTIGERMGQVDAVEVVAAHIADKGMLERLASD